MTAGICSREGVQAELERGGAAVEREQEIGHVAFETFFERLFSDPVWRRAEF
jgi:hypothetical protein